MIQKIINDTSSHTVENSAVTFPDKKQIRSNIRNSGRRVKMSSKLTSIKWYKTKSAIAFLVHAGTRIYCSILDHSFVLFVK
jgi:hypothetical protein